MIFHEQLISENPQPLLKKSTCPFLLTPPPKSPLFANIENPPTPAEREGGHCDCPKLLYSSKGMCWIDSQSKKIDTFDIFKS